MKIACLIVATRKYKRFVDDLLQSIDKYFINNEEVDVILYIDDVNFELKKTNRKLHKIQIPSYVYPQATLYRYKVMNDSKDLLLNFDHMVYIDVSMVVSDKITSDMILNEYGLVAVLHPGFYPNFGGTYETNTNSLAYLDRGYQKYPYVQGSIQGGTKESYLKAIQIMDQRINDDEINNIIAVWHDESHWNKYINETVDSVKLLHPVFSYAPGFMRPDEKPIITKLVKNHEEIRSL